MRIDAREGYADKLGALPICSDYSMVFGVKHHGHDGENPHYHVCVRTHVKKQAFRHRMKQIFTEGKGNGHMSIKDWDGHIHAISYMFHEDHLASYVVRHNITDEELTEAKRICEKIKTAVAAAKEKASWRLEEEVYNDFRDNWERPYKPYDEQIGKAIILQALRSGRYVPQTWLLRAMVTRIQFRLLDGAVDAEEEFAEKMAHNIFS